VISLDVVKIEARFHRIPINCSPLCLRRITTQKRSEKHRVELSLPDKSQVLIDVGRRKAVRYGGTSAEICGDRKQDITRLNKGANGLRISRRCNISKILQKQASMHDSRVSATARSKSQLLWFLARRCRMSSSTASTAEVMNRHPLSRNSGSSSA
jgi:hypothetical protein